eukprot:9489248-Pyramimonas_sp.AAC.1
MLGSCDASKCPRVHHRARARLFAERPVERVGLPCSIGFQTGHARESTGVQPCIAVVELGLSHQLDEALGRDGSAEALGQQS